MDEPALRMLGLRLKELREAAGLTQLQLADKAGLSQRGVSQWERGEREPSWGNILALAAALGVSCEAFNKEPTTPQTPAGPGRPRKATQEESEPAPKRKPGRPKKTD